MACLPSGDVCDDRRDMRIGALLSFALALKLHHHFHGPAVDYAGLALASAASWIGVPGPGEPVLIAAGVFAAKHNLDIVSVLVVAWLGATVGGIGGWAAGMKGGRALLTSRGPLAGMRAAALARGDDVFRRFTVVAILLTPSWIAGIHHVRAAVYLPVNAAAAALWAAGIGLGAYYVGPTVVEFVGDLGLVTGIGLGVLVAAVVIAEVLRRRRRAVDRG
jgi:membrane protein DedA with SNARE-associated domain